MFRNALVWSELWEGEMRQVLLGKSKVLIARIEGQPFAYADRCSHLGVPLSEGKLEGKVITCKAHQFKYDACSGRGINPSNVCLKRYATKIDGDSVAVDVDDEDV